MSLAKEIRQALDVEPELVKGDSGVLDVIADGTVVFSKHRDGRFPAPGEIAGMIGAAR